MFYIILSSPEDTLSLASLLSSRIASFLLSPAARHQRWPCKQSVLILLNISFRRRWKGASSAQLPTPEITFPSLLPDFAPASGLCGKEKFFGKQRLCGEEVIKGSSSWYHASNQRWYVTDLGSNKYRHIVRQTPRRTFIPCGKTFRNNSDRDLHILQVRFESSIIPLFRQSFADGEITFPSQALFQYHNPSTGFGHERSRGRASQH